MKILSTIADLLETGAHALRAAGAAPGTPFPLRPVAASASGDAARPEAKPVGPPLGYWRCVHAAPISPFDEFTVGSIYECRLLDGIGSMRIAPWDGSAWSPFWSDHDGRFCYAAADLDFAWVGTALPDGEAAVTAMPDRKAARIAR